MIPYKYNKGYILDKKENMIDIGHILNIIELSPVLVFATRKNGPVLH
jgi:hypothetical protein